MIDESSMENIRNIIVFGINRTAILYNMERINDPEKYDLQYQKDYLNFRERRSKDPAFLRYIFEQSHNSSNFESNRKFITKAVLMDLCEGKFNTYQLSGIADLESFHSKNKEGNYNPRHSRRMLNDELKELVIKKGRGDDDERKINYTTAFTMKYDNIDSSMEPAKKMWEDEVKQNLENSDNSLSVSMTGFLMQIFPEKWDDIMRMKDVMIKTLESFDNEIKAKDNFNALSSEIPSISPYFIMLYEHINSISEIYWFMKKDSNKRASMLAEKPKLMINTSDIEKILDTLKKSGMETSRIVDILILAKTPLMSYSFNDVAIFLMKKLIAMNGKLSVEMALELSAVLRESGRYKYMLDFTENAFKNLDADQDLFSFSLFKIRYAEALALNRRRNDAIIILNEIFSKRDQFTDAYIPYKNLIKNASNFVLTENGKSLENNATPVRVSLLVNLASASLRIGEYCLVEKYLEELFNTEKEFFKNKTSTDMLLQLNNMYMKAIMKCNSM